MKTLIMLIGLPGSGKSTHRDDFVAISEIANSPVDIISLDVMIEATMTPGESYAEAFLRIQKTGELKQMDKQMYLDAAKFNKEKNPDDYPVVIWDQTNLTAKSRKRKLDMFDDSWFKEARVFELTDDEWNRRLTKRQKETGKSIPAHVLNDMAKSYERPSLDESFNFIQYM